MQALMRAAKAGKEVTVFVEVKARFDEELNLRWADQLEKAGAKVLYSFPGLKVHAKVAIVTRKENGILRDYLYLSTGNFNEKTAKIYVDFGLFSTNEILAKETHAIFYYLATNRVVAGMFNHLLVGQFNLQTTLLELIDNEILNAKKGLNAYILLKMNSLEDKKMIDKLYLASQAGVKIDLIVRGIFCLKSGVKGLSDNINSISIIDRFLEHTRAFYFYNNGNDKLYLSSADWMVRNLHYRIETAFPIDNPTIKQEILYLLRLQLEDNVKGRILDAQLENNYNQGTEKQDFTSRIRSQIVAYDYWREKAANVDDVLVL
jgi:polyphosphate kinase